MTAIGYIRLSNEDQSNYSIESQDRQIREYCARNNLRLLQIYTDNGESSYTFDRKAFGDLEKEIKKAKYLVVYHLDRFSRNMSEAMIKIKQYLERGIRVRDITEPVDMDDYDPNTFMVRAMKFMVAESELHRIRARTKSGLVQAAMNGRFTSTAPIGYKNARDANNKPILLIDDEKSDMIRILFREYLNGIGIADLRRMLARYSFPLRGNSAIQRILANPIYAGFIRVPATRSKPAHLVKGLHDAIVIEHDYWLVQDRLKGKPITVQNSDEVPLRGVLYCSCGRVMTAGNSKGRNKYYWYYVCHECKISLSASRLHQQLDDLLDHMSLNGDALKFLRLQLRGKLKDHTKNREEKVAQVKRQLGIVEGKIMAVEERYLLRPDLSEQTYNKVITELRADQSRLYKELAGLNTNHEVYAQRVDSILAGISDLKGSFERLTIEKKHQFLNWVFDKSLHYEEGIYRTAHVPDFFRHNLHELKEKGLLELVAPVKGINDSPIGTRDGKPVESDFLHDIDYLCNILTNAA